MKKQLLAFLAVFALALSPILPAAAAVSVAITSPTASSTTASDFTVTGTAEAGNEVTVSINGTDVGTTTADGSGNWSLDVTGQTEGAKTITATSKGDVHVHIGSFANTDMTILNAATDTAIAGTPFSVGAVQPAAVVITPDQQTMYMTNLNDLNGEAAVYIVDLATRTVTGTIVVDNAIDVTMTFEHMTLNNAGDRLYVINTLGGSGSELYIIDTATNTLINTVGALGSNFGLAISPDDSTLYFANPGDVRIFDIASTTVTGTITGTPSTHVTINADGSTLYASEASNPGNIRVIDTATEAVTDTITGGRSIANMVLSPDESILYAASHNDWSSSPGEESSVLAIDTATNTITDEVSTGRLTFGLDITPDGSKLYVVNFGNPFDAFAGAGTWTIDTSTNIATFLTGSETLNSVQGSSFIIQETATASVDITVAESTETLADTGINNQLAIIVATTMLIASIYLYRTRQYTSYKR